MTRSRHSHPPQGGAESASEVLVPVGDPPRYYGLGWQILLWLATAVLATLMMFG